MGVNNVTSHSLFSFTPTYYRGSNRLIPLQPSLLFNMYYLHNVMHANPIPTVPEHFTVSFSTLSLLDIPATVPFKSDPL